MRFEGDPNPLAKAEQNFFEHYKYLITMFVLESKYGKDQVEHADLSITPQLKEEVRAVLPDEKAKEINSFKSGMLGCVTLGDLEKYCKSNFFDWPDQSVLEKLKGQAIENMEKESEDDATGG